MTARRRRSRGQTLVEFALAVPLFAMVFVGVAEGGYYVVASTIVNHATHEGARFGVLSSTGSADAVRSRVRSEADAITDSLTKIDVCINDLPCTNGNYVTRAAGDRLTVRTEYTHSPLLGYVFGGLTIPADAEAELRVEGGPST